MISTLIAAIWTSQWFFSGMTPVEHKRAFFGMLEDLESLFGRCVDLIEVGAVRNPFVRSGIEATQEPLYAASG